MVSERDELAGIAYQWELGLLLPKGGFGREIFLELADAILQAGFRRISQDTAPADRDELIALVYQKQWIDADPLNSDQGRSEDIASAIIAAGWRPPGD